MTTQSAGLLPHRGSEWPGRVALSASGGPFWSSKRGDGARSIPKGEVPPAEPFLTVATREFEEELGMPPLCWVRLPGQHPPAGGKVVRRSIGPRGSIGNPRGRMLLPAQRPFVDRLLSVLDRPDRAGRGASVDHQVTLVWDHQAGGLVPLKSRQGRSACSRAVLSLWPAQAGPLDDEEARINAASGREQHERTAPRSDGRGIG